MGSIDETTTLSSADTEGTTMPQSRRKTRSNECQQAIVLQKLVFILDCQSLPTALHDLHSRHDLYICRNTW